MIKWDCIEKLNDERFIAEFEQEIGWVLPESYKVFVRENNSCQPEKRTCFSVDGNEVELNHFYNLNKGSVISIWDFYDFPEEDRKWFKEQYGGELNDHIAFADDTDGNAVCFYKVDGSVTHYDRENDKMSTVAPDFAAFLAALYVHETDETVD